MGGVIPDQIDDPLVYPGGTLTGNVCWEVPSGDAPGLVMYDNPLFLLEPFDIYLSLTQ